MRKRTKIYILMPIAAAAIILWSILPLLFHRPPQYDIIDLGNFGLDHIEPDAINDYGQIVGHFSPANGLLYGSSRAFVYDDVNGLNEMDKSCTSLWALDINNRGQVVGLDPTSPVLSDAYLFLWDPESGKTDSIISETGTIITASDIEINNKGRIAGTIRKFDPAQQEAFIWDKQKGFTLLGTLGGKQSVAYSINDKGQIAGWSDTDKGYRHAYIWDDVNGMTDLGTLGGDDSMAFVVNNKSQVMGHSRDSKYNSYMVIWDERHNVRRIKKIGGLDLNCRVALNDNGQLIGTYQKATGSWSLGKWFLKRTKRTTACPFIWSQQRGFVDLDYLFAANPEQVSFAIVDINNKGQILARGRNDHIFILQPKKKKDENKN